ncbi:MAG: lipid-A-disaccharide synthase [Pseudomonadota bacterium]
MSEKKENLVLIIAGEASADLHGSNLVMALRKMAPEIGFRGIGGEQMRAAGVDILIPSADMAVVGLTEVFAKLPTIAKAFFRLKAVLKHQRPDLLILIDYPDFNIHLARSAKRLGIPVLYYISPQVWAWRKGRVKKLAARVDQMAVILPFEESFYRKHGLTVDYVGHPILDAVPAPCSRSEAIGKLGLEGANPVLGLLPGSRRDEVNNLLPLMVKAAGLLASRCPDLKCVLPVASTISPDLVQSMTAKACPEIKLTHQGVYQALAACDLAFVASGTATLETAMMEVPMIVTYRVSPISYRIGKMVIRVPHIALVNLVAGEEIVPEIIQDEVTPERLAEEAMALLAPGRKREKMIKQMRAVKERLGKGGASEKTARIALQMIRGKNGKDHISRR